MLLDPLEKEMPNWCALVNTFGAREVNHMGYSCPLMMGGKDVSASQHGLDPPGPQLPLCELTHLLCPR